MKKEKRNAHYKSNPKRIEPWDYVAANDLGFFEGNVVKYVTRWRDKNGVEDLQKAIDYLNKLIDLEGKDDPAIQIHNLQSRKRLDRGRR